MDEIEKFLKENMTHYDNGYFTFKRFDLKKLIELVENEQVKKCSKQNLTKLTPTGISDNKESVQNAPRISEQIDWEEL